MTSKEPFFDEWETKTEDIYREMISLEKIQEDIPEEIADILTSTLSKPTLECRFCGVAHHLPCEEQLAARKKRDQMHTKVEFTEDELNYLRERLGSSLAKGTHSTEELKEYLKEM